MLRGRRALLAPLALLLTSCVPGSAVEAAEPQPYPLPETLTEHQRLITIVGSNDMHGGALPIAARFGPRRGQLQGGLAIWSGVVASLRRGLGERYGEQGGVLLLDAGDQFQGTLISNFDQGQLVYDVMNLMAYDAAIPGNHGFDFGPIAEMDSRTGDIVVTDPKGPDNHLGALARLAAKADFPLLSANTYLRSSLADAEGRAVEVDQVGCAPKAPGAAVDWSRARNPDLFQRYAIREVAGVRVAVIGIDHHESSLTTKASNVAHLCFRDEVETFEEVRSEIAEQADVFVLLIHNGDSKTDHELSEITEKLTGGERDLVDAVVAGHTHFTNNVFVNGVAAVQSSSSTRMFGRIDLVWDAEAKRVDKSRTRYRAGIGLWPDACDPETASFCEVRDEASGEVGDLEVRVAYEGVPVVPDERVAARIGKAEAELSALADRVLGEATARLTSDRISESPLADRMTDAMLAAAAAATIGGEPADVDFAIVNTGGLRAPIDAGPVTYEEIFAVMPFDNQMVAIDCPRDQLVAVMRRSAMTCGSHGAVIASGMRVEFNRRDCRVDEGPGNASELVRITAADGSVLFPPPAGDAAATYRVATLDFLAEGGSGYEPFAECAPVGSFGALRQVLVHRFVEQPFTWDASLDGRFRQLNAAPE